MHCVFILLENDWFDDPCVVLFETEEAANEFIWQTLLAKGEFSICDDGGIICTYSSDDSYKDRDDAIDQWQQGLGGTEFFHVYEAHITPADALPKSSKVR